jgi:hypothetical protein
VVGWEPAVIRDCEFLGAGMTAPSVVRYALDDETVVMFEVDPAGVFMPSGPEEIVGRSGTRWARWWTVPGSFWIGSRARGRTRSR